ncbi:unnamed protein product [Bursaphelenchus xylophilus]|uniref:(pine wood nematode) hypothetical protein n=1 Tax=Bursaphelenchus xylophilus TaxID=6326 RepID=A0A1I7SEX7_BURXY|nr:unnamed protein product [Bursaphelenchus xylophilus]CAG9113729.1 unnamed protein product [Bursaphelenchus xylophilus]
MGIIKSLALLSLATVVAGDFEFNSTTVGGSLYFEVKLRKNSKPYKVQVDSNRPYSIFMHNDCKTTKCSLYWDKADTYDPSATGGIDTKLDFEDISTYDDKKLKGRWFSETLKLNSKKFPIHIGAAMEATETTGWQQAGVIGLGIGSGREDAKIAERLMATLTTPLITVQEGKTHKIKKDSTDEDKESRGSITFGKYNATSCGDFTWVDCSDRGSWTFKTTITIGEKQYEGKVVGFAIGQNTFASRYTIHAFHFAKYLDNESDFPKISFEFGGKTFEMNPKDYVSYSPGYGKHAAEIKNAPSYSNIDFALGSEFLQNYCVAFRADKEFKKLEIGLAVNHGRPAEDKKPDDDGKTPDKKPDDDGKTPDKKPDDDGKTPDKKPEDDGKTPDKKPEDDGKTPDKKPNEDGKTPDKQPNEDGKTHGGEGEKKSAAGYSTSIVVAIAFFALAFQ